MIALLTHLNGNVTMPEIPERRHQIIFPVKVRTITVQTPADLFCINRVLGLSHDEGNK
jgi:hypothetical protein